MSQQAPTQAGLEIPPCRATTATECAGPPAPPFVVIGVDAIPAPLLALTLPVIAVNPEDRMDDIAADSDGADLLAAIAMGANQARALGADTAHLFGSGLPVCGALDMTRPGMLAADLTEVATFLRANGSLPDLTGFTIELEVG